MTAPRAADRKAKAKAARLSPASSGRSASRGARQRSVGASLVPKVPLGSK